MRMLLMLIGLTLLIACKKPTATQNEEQALSPTIEIQEKRTFSIGAVSADNEFDGARLNDFKQLDETTYQAFITPETTPVNKSPWYSFRIWAEEATDITLEIAYAEDFEHRYVPKLSHDGVTWEACQSTQYTIDTTNGSLRLALSLTPEKLWVSAQENLNLEYMTTWVNAQAQRENVEKVKVGESVSGHPIHLLRIKEDAPHYSMVVIGRQHPPEVPGGTISLISFVQTLLADSELAKTFRDEFEILVFPLLNPDGVEQGHWRHNANGQDLNRDWVAFSQPETRAVRNWLINARETDESSEYCFGIDFHTSYSGPYLLVLDTIPHAVKPEITSEWIRRIESERQEQLDIRPRAQNLPYCYNWMINELGVEAVTYEEGDEVDRDVIRKRAADYANVLMTILLEKYSGDTEQVEGIR